LRARVELRTLGGTDLRDPVGNELRPVLAQSKRLALLTFISLAAPSGFCRRDTVIGLFWPDLDDEHARGSLRQALTFLRRTLGEDVVVTRGDDEIGVDRSALWCDQAAFVNACDEQRHADALELYRGPFLDGLFVTDAAPEFERWVDEQRDGLRRRAGVCAWALAAKLRLTGDRAGAAAMARRAAALAPDDEGELAKLVTFLDEQGDRAGALTVHDEFARRLRHDFDADPSPETQALIRGVRARAVAAPSAAGSESAPATLPGTSGVGIEAAQRPMHRDRRWWLVAGVGVSLAASALAYAGYRTRRPDQLTIAVLPIEDLGGDTAQAYVAEGLSDQLVTDLAQTGTLRVISSRTMNRYRRSNMTAREIAAELHADAIIMGTMQRLDDTVRMTAQLVLGGDERAIWAQGFEGSRGDLLRIQSEVARQVVQRLRRATGGGQRDGPERVRRFDPEALDLYIRGRFWWNRRGRDGLLSSIDLFTRALAADPTFALAYSGMADAYVQLGYGSLLAPDDAFPKAEAAASQALALDPTLAEPHAALGFVQMYYRWDWASADKEFQRALELSPSYATGHEWYGLFLTAMGRFAEAGAQERRARELDPLSSAVAGTSGWVMFYSGQLDSAAEALRIALRFNPGFDLGHLYLGRVYQATGQLDSALAEYAAIGALRNWVPTVAGVGYVYALQGRRREALRVLAQMYGQARHTYVTAYAIALIHAALGQRDSAFSWLDQGVRERTHWLVWLNRDTRWIPLKGDPRFQALVQRVGLPN